MAAVLPHTFRGVSDARAADGTSSLSRCLRSGVDVTPVVWFALLSFLNEILLGRQGLLVLLSEKTPVV